jgi:hypothetical protein
MCIEVMSKEEFCNQIGVIEDFMERMNVLKDVLDVESNDDVTVYDMIIYNNIDNLSRLCGVDNSWIEWYIYETNFGKKNTKVNRVGRKTKHIDTAMKLYNLIEQQRNLRYLDIHSEYPVDKDLIGSTVFVTEDGKCANIKVYNSIGYGVLVEACDCTAVVDKYKELEYIV